MDVGTAKVRPEESGGIPHHLIDILDPVDAFSVSDYQRRVRMKIAELHGRGVLPVVVGGSGLYVQSALYDYRFAGAGRDPKRDAESADVPTVDLYEALRKRDPARADVIGSSNRRRILRMLDMLDSANPDAIDSENGKIPYYPDLILIGLQMPRAMLAERIASRVERMMKDGLLDEVRALHDRNVRTQAVQAIGYRELYRHFDGELDLPTAVEQIKIHSRQYAKRQMTWFKNRMAVDWFTVDPDDFSATVHAVFDVLDGRLEKR
ncbi:MAG TPA: tRNA (adenosine(37)-N6)-dimethylallyltransferase MiaA [Acholeplasmatales bacterium]|nr:tRNA (adenosine(37)-N6)-dimethylallyltransferase MiaA [Acholeplasmatales bacterium]